MKFFATPNSRNIIETLPIVTIEKSELPFLLILHFAAFQKSESPVSIVIEYWKHLGLFFMIKSTNVRFSEFL